MSFLDRETAEFARSFWAPVNSPKLSFPRDLDSILWVHNLTVIALPRLDVLQVQEWLHDNGSIVPSSVRGHQRRVFGCLVAYGGGGYIFLDSESSAVEQRFTIAHEVGHFLRDYLRPRKNAVSKLGNNALDILDGKRPPSNEEKVHAVLSAVQLNYYTDLLLRGEDNRIISQKTSMSEVKADEIALEILAPYKMVLSLAGIEPFCVQSKQIEELILPLLILEFGLPKQYADVYTKRLVDYFKKRDTVREWLGL